VDEVRRRARRRGAVGPQGALCTSGRHPYFAAYASATRRTAASSLTAIAWPSTTRSSVSLLVVMTHRGSAAMFLALRDRSLAQKYTTPSATTANTGTTCGRPSGFTVASQYVPARSRPDRA
jgi:hypothetical protein